MNDIPRAIAHSPTVQTAVSLLLVAIRAESRQKGFSAINTLNAVDRDPLDAEITALIEQRFNQVLQQKDAA